MKGRTKNMLLFIVCMVIFVVGLTLEVESERDKAWSKPSREVLTQKQINDIRLLKYTILEPVKPLKAIIPTGAKLISRSLPSRSDGRFKSYMDYRTITDETSLQYKLQQDAITDVFGFRRYNDYYMVAVGTFYSKKVGQKFNIELQSGKTFNVIVADIKMDIHTDEANHQYDKINNSIIEFIVNVDRISSNSRIRGNMIEFSGPIKSIEEILE